MITFNRMDGRFNVRATEKVLAGDLICAGVGKRGIHGEPHKREGGAGERVNHSNKDNIPMG